MFGKSFAYWRHRGATEGHTGRASEPPLSKRHEGGRTCAPVAWHCLPTTLANSRSWELLLHNPLRLPDRMLTEMLPIRISSQNSSHGKDPQQTIVYIRSFHMTAGQLRVVASQFHDNGLRYAKVATWLECTRDMRSEEVVYDSWPSFLRVLKNYFPTVIDSVALYIFPSRQLQGVREVERFNEISEQAVIALLGIRFLLNQTCTSTAAWDFEPTEDHRREFQALRTKSVSRLLPSSFRSHPRQRSIGAWADGIQSYAREHPRSVSLFRNRIHGFPDALREMIVRQSAPSALHGDIEDFYGGSSDSARIIRNLLNRLWNWEQRSTPEQDYVQDLLSAGALPFVDLCPWLSATGEDLDAAAHFLKRYISLVKLHIILTLSEKPSSIIASESLDTESRPPDFWSSVGELELVRFRDHCCIQIPCFHPGQGRFFSVAPRVFLTTLERTLWILFLTISVSLDSAEQARTGSSEDWCRYVKKEVEDVVHTRGVGESFQTLKCRLRNERPKSAPTTILTPKERSRIAIATRKDVDYFIFSGFAADRAMSGRRRQQDYRLWELNIPELHLHIDREDPRNWFLWVNSLEEGKSLFVEAIASTVWAAASARMPGSAVERTSSCTLIEAVGLSEEYRELLSGTMSKQWISYDDIVEAITTELSTQVPLWRCLHASRISQELAQSGILRFKALYRTRLNGAEVVVWQNCSVPIYWLSPSGRKYKFIMRAPRSSLTVASGQRKYIFFTKDGIDLRDDSGASCLAQKGTLSAVENKVTFPVRHLPNCQDTAELGNRLVELWESETGYDWFRTTSSVPGLAQQDAADETETAHPRSFYSNGGLSIIRSNWNEQKLEPYQRPPLPGDETWLLWMCLKDSWPNGGTLFIGLPEKWPSRRDNIWVHFCEFLSRSVYRYHPRLAQVQAWAQDISYAHKTPQMVRNLEHLCVILGKKKIQERDHDRIKREGRDVKIAGTELRIKHRW
ncbi:hypothetical protein BJX61DRAFT_547844 [Aspergillus egyptiacus]|nr:hypothetical protein BJX61DRAFT_547844 [Aspergillus egyptiacus]